MCVCLCVSACAWPGSCSTFFCAVQFSTNKIQRAVVSSFIIYFIEWFGMMILFFGDFNITHIHFNMIGIIGGVVPENAVKLSTGGNTAIDTFAAIS